MNRTIIFGVSLPIIYLGAYPQGGQDNMFDLGPFISYILHSDCTLTTITFLMQYVHRPNL